MTGKLLMHRFAYALIDAMTATDDDLLAGPQPTKVLRFVDESGVETELLFRTPEGWAEFQRQVAEDKFPTGLVKATESDLARLNGHV